jgi:hypothetical protein
MLSAASSFAGGRNIVLSPGISGRKLKGGSACGIPSRSAAVGFMRRCCALDVA